MDNEVGVVASVVDVGSGSKEEENESVSDSTTTTTTGQAEEQKKRVQNQDALFGMLAFTSFVLLVQSAYDCDKKTEYFSDYNDCKDKLAFAVSVAVISLFIVIVHFLIVKVPEVNAGCTAWKKFIEPFLVLALWIMWLVAAIILTYPDHHYEGYSFVSASTGWLMIWISVGILTAAMFPSFHPAWMWCQSQWQFLKLVGAPDGQSVIHIVVVALCSVTVMWSGADVCDSLNSTKTLEDCSGMYAWAVVCPMFSLLYCLFLLIFGKALKIREIAYQVISVFLALWWFVGACTLCVSKPFANTAESNGFFGTWLALYFSVKIAQRGLGIKLDVGYFGDDA